MGELETLMWRGERHPEFSSVGLVMEILESTPEWERFRRAHEWATRLVPRLRERVVEPAMSIGPPAWATDPDFDIDHHLHRTSINGGGIQAALELAQEFLRDPQDRARALWSGMLVTGLPDGRAAYLLRSHHSLMDGAGAMQLFASLHSDHAAPTPNKPLPAPRERSAPTSAELAVAHLASELRNAPGRAVSLTRAVGQAIASPGAAVRFLASARRVIAAPTAGAPSPLLARQAGREWRFGTLDCGLAELKAAGRAVGGSVNDAYVAALLGGLRLYHAGLGHELGDVPTVIPVSIRRTDDPLGGNQFTSVFFAGPSGSADPAERIAAMRGAVLSAREEPALDVLGTLAPILTRTPSPLLARLLKAAPRAELSASNVPGLIEPAYAAGAKVERMYIFGPLPGVTMLSTLCSYVGICCIGINCDGDVYDDPGRLWECMREGLDEVLALGRS